MKKTKCGISHYNKPTPKKWRILGDTLLSVSAFITAEAISHDVNWLGYTALGIGVVGKFLTNFFAEEEA